MASQAAKWCDLGLRRTQMAPQAAKWCVKGLQRTEMKELTAFWGGKPPERTKNYNAMKNFYDDEALCAQQFYELGECWHLWTPENFEIIFTCEEDFKAGMGIIGIAAKLYPDVRILTFQLMTNHLHMTLSGRRERIVEMFGEIRSMLRKYFKAQGRTIDWSKFTAQTRALQTLEDVRNVIIYNNRNGYVVNPSSTPFTYPWGANRYYFNPDAKELAGIQSVEMTYKQRRAVSHTHKSNDLAGLKTFKDYALPTSFCDIEAGERLFRNPAHYFSKISRSIEADAKIAKEIGESVFCTDDDLYSAVCRMAAEKFSKLMGASGGIGMGQGHGAGQGVASQAGGAGGQTFGRQISPAQLPAQAKLEIAKTMRFEYNASSKQLQRMLKLDEKIISTLFTNNQPI